MFHQYVFSECLVYCIIFCKSLDRVQKGAYLYVELLYIEHQYKPIVSNYERIMSGSVIMSTMQLTNHLSNPVSNPF